MPKSTSPTQRVKPPVSIEAIFVEGLFGHYKYELRAKSVDREGANLLLLYGENGSGKTTMLSLLYHLLSKEPAKGHRTFLAKTRFSRLAVWFSDGTKLTAFRKKGETAGSFELKVVKGASQHRFFYKTDNEGAIPNLAEDAHHVNFLKHIPDFALYFIPDDRKMSTEIELEEREWTRQSEMRQMAHYLSVRGLPAASSVPRSEPILSKVMQWVREQALAGSNQGQLNVNTIYSDIVARIVGPALGEPFFQSPDELARTLAEQAVRTHKYSYFGLTSELEVGNLIRSVLENKKNKTQMTIITQILKPFIEGNEARLLALEPIQRTLETFVNNVNSFYSGKKLTFNIREGVRFVSETGEAIDPSQLSSGEKQLLILFCNVIMTSRSPAIFFIDEPELSLNMKWQRQLVNAILSCVPSGSVQFVLATHSLEILARHRSRVAQLINLEAHRKASTQEAV
jgi:energy-coupling factor transporter ATP-binding protein EcfA2